ncbi:MAG: EF-P lysine aminoacylase EpmA [Pseudomonadota bacterium]
MTDWQPDADRAVLRERAALFATIREFFARRGVLEVDTPVLGRYGVTDPGIEPLMLAQPDDGAMAGPRFLQTSPEFAMKRLLAAGSGPIYQMGKVFRRGEVGVRHNPEFTLLEWYRPGFSLDALIEEVGDLVAACLGGVQWQQQSYRDLFLETLSIDPLSASDAELALLGRQLAENDEIELTRDGWLDLLMTHAIEPGLRERGAVAVVNYPASQAALARCEEVEGHWVARRFEFYIDGLELANGYDELLDSEELIARAARDNQQRESDGLEHRELDPRLVAAMNHRLPACSGVALGVDRLLMRRLTATSISGVMPFSWERA